MQEGSKVVCINDDFPQNIHQFYDNLPKKGCVYTIRSMEVGVDWFGNAGEIAVTLVELTNPVSETWPHRERAFNSQRFADLEPLTEEEVAELAEMQEPIGI